MRFRAVFLAICLCAASASVLDAQTGSGKDPAKPPGREISVPPNQVKDSFFAYAIGILVAGLDVEMTNQELRDVLTEFKNYVNLPFDLIKSVRSSGDASTGRMDFSVEFYSAVKIPIPFSFLGYHPGSILATQDLDFAESRPSPDATSPAVPLYVLRLSMGLVTIDVDDWLTFLFPKTVDDLYVELFAIFRYRETWYGLLSGLGRKGEQLREYFDFTRNKIIFPVPKDLEAIGADIAEGRLGGAQ